jgi:hypothetical protein
MPKFKKLSAEELATFRAPVSGERARVREEYKSYLKGLKPGEGGELRLVEDEKKTSVKNRIKRAADDMGVEIQFKRSDQDSVRFAIVEPNS